MTTEEKLNNLIQELKNHRKMVKCQYKRDLDVFENRVIIPTNKDIYIEMSELEIIKEKTIDRMHTYMLFYLGLDGLINKYGEDNEPPKS
jgi:hypothetical protein